MMQLLGAIFANQEYQRLTDTWVTNSITNISASSGCAIEAAPTPQPVITLLPALVRLAGGAARWRILNGPSGIGFFGIE